MRPPSSNRRRSKNFARDVGGVAVIEFAFIAPILIFFYFGLAETCQMLMAQRRVSHASAALSDLITQDTEIGNEEMLQLYEAACTIMRPFPVRAVRIRITSASRRAAGTGANSIMADWSDDNGRGLTKVPIPTDLSGVDAAVKVETPLESVGASVVVAEVEYDMLSPIGYFLPAATELTHKSEMRPRKSQMVARVAASPPGSTSAVAKTCS